jgi:hypothetical protein
MMSFLLARAIVDEVIKGDSCAADIYGQPKFAAGNEFIQLWSKKSYERPDSFNILAREDTESNLHRGWLSQ